MSEDAASAAQPRLDVFNKQLVGWQAGDIFVMMPVQRMTKQEALVHAAWLVALADDNDEFPAILTAVQNT